MKKIFGSAAVILALAMSAGCSQVDTGSVGVKTLAGKTDPVEIAPGWSLTWFASVDEFTVKEFPIVLNDMKPQTKDQLRMADVDIDVYIKAVPDKVAETKIKYLGDVVRHKDIDPKGTSDLIAGYNRVFREARESVYRAVAEFKSDEIHLKREDVGASVAAKLQAELNKSDPGTWVVTGFNVRSLLTDPTIDASIQAKVRLDQQIAAKNKEKDLAVAEGERLLAEATGQARANEKLASSLTPGLIRMRELEVQKAFAGAGTHTVLMGGNSSGTLINVGK